MTQADDTNAVDGWIASAKNLKAELDSVKSMAEEKARVAADVAAHNLSIATIWTFFGLLIGLPPWRRVMRRISICSMATCRSRSPSMCPRRWRRFSPPPAGSLFPLLDRASQDSGL